MSRFLCPLSVSLCVRPQRRFTVFTAIASLAFVSTAVSCSSENNQSEQSNSPLGPEADDDHESPSLEDDGGIVPIGDGGILGGENQFTKAQVTVFFSPLPIEISHVAEAAKIISEAVNRVDIAIYSYRSPQIDDAIESAIARGVRVRVLYEKAGKDRKLEDSKLENSTSGRFEKMGADVRYVNKINHHKFVIVDGPTTPSGDGVIGTTDDSIDGVIDDPVNAPSDAKVLSGSANFRSDAATKYDETTLLIENSNETAMAFQTEFETLWKHSRDFILPTFPLKAAQTAVTSGTEEDDPGIRVGMTSANFKVNEGTTTFSPKLTRMVAADLWVEAIEAAQSQILIASGHLRLQPVAEALIAKRAANPKMDIRVYLDQQEYIGYAENQQQIVKRENCIIEAELIENEGKRNREMYKCTHRGFRWSRKLADEGVDVRFKAFAYRWHYVYAPQMHNKWMVVDGNRVLTGSYNLSINAEHNSFENLVEFSGSDYQYVAAEFLKQFEMLWHTGEGTLTDLHERVATEDPVPLVFADTPIALSNDEVAELRALILENCPQAESEVFSKFPAQNQKCPREAPPGN